MDYKKYCALTFNGMLLDEIIKGYQTINVEGRGLKPKKIELTDIPGRIGSYINGSTYYPNSLKVYFLIKAINDKEKRKTLDELNIRLHSKEDVVFSFGDEKGYRIGRLKDVESIPFDNNEGIGYFEIYCQYPFRILESIENTATTQYKINYPGVFELEFEEFRITPDNKNEVRIRNINNGDIISLKNLDNTKEIILNKDSITQNGANIVNKLDWTISKWKNFKVSNEDLLQYQGGSFKSKIRGLML